MDRSFSALCSYFKASGNLARNSVRVDDRIGFVFRLPPEACDITWTQFPEELDSITAIEPDHPEAGEINAPATPECIPPVITV